MLPDGEFSKRLTGLHFYKTKEYYDALGDLILELFYSPEQLTKFFEGLDWDEEGLYKLCASKFNLEVLKKPDCVRPWHGLHLGAASKHKPNFKTEDRFFNNAYHSKEECRLELEVALKDKLFRKIVKTTRNRSLFNFFRFLKVKNLSLSLRWILWQYQLKSFLR